MFPLIQNMLCFTSEYSIVIAYQMLPVIHLAAGGREYLSKIQMPGFE